MNSSKNYKNVWNDEKKFFCAKDSNGTWDCPKTWLDVWDPRYVEGDAWHWRWFVPHDPYGLIELFGSNETFIEQLNEFFYRSEFDPLNVLPNPYYWAGNEPDLFAVWFFNFANRPDLSAKYSRKVMKTRYTTAPSGLAGNDDYGTLSAWFVFASIGIFPQAGTNTYLFGSPLFDKIVINR